ncbi:putative UDP-sugar transporter [Trichoplax sp. H2]|nr:putative UDP-sugar transporter [Trichoplax sp. H2]|eukprot:RDD39915.1 putative UDP-sugar transporter [Trichoplax sp. H2]
MKHGQTHSQIEDASSSTDQDLAQKSSTTISLLAALFYGVISGSIAFVNKAVMTTFGFPYPVVLVLVQMILTLIILRLLHYFQLIKLIPFTMENGRKLMLPALCYAINTTFAISALTDLNIPMYTVMKRLGLLMNLILSVILLSKIPSVMVCFSIALIITGCIVAGMHDLSSHIFGYVNALISVVSQSIYLTLVERAGARTEFSTSSILYLNTVNCLPFQILIAIITGEIYQATTYTRLRDWRFQAVFFFAAGLGCLLNYSLFLCTTVNSALTTSIVGVIKGLVTTIIGFFTFGGVPATTFTVAGVSINMIGAILYTYAKYKDKLTSNKV